MPKNNKSAAIKTLVFVLITAMLLLPGAKGMGAFKERQLPSAIKEVLSWMA